MCTGADTVGLTVLPGVSAQVAPTIAVVHETETVELNDPAAVI